MRVAYVCADAGVPVFGSKGASVHVQSILRAFLRRGDSVDLYAARTGREAPADLASISVHPIGPAGPRPSSIGSVSSGESNRAVDHHLAAALAERMRTYDVVYERHALWSSSAMRLARARGVPGILEVNAPLVDEQMQHRQLADPDLARRLVGKALWSARLRVAVSHEVAVRHGRYGFEPEDFLVCSNGVDPARFRDPLPAPPIWAETSERSGSRTADDPFTVGFLGTLKPWHGLDVLMDAFTRLARRSSGYRLLIVGDGPMRALIETRLDSEGLRGRAHFSGAVDPADVPRWLACMDVGTAPYADRDGLYFSPLKIVEYQAAGLPVVASEGGQVRELIRDGIDGLLVEPGDAPALAEGIERMRLDPSAARAMGVRGRERVFATRSWDAILDRILAAVPDPLAEAPPLVGSRTSTECTRG